MSVEPGRRLRILLTNWQDREHPQAGGAEVHLHEVFGRLVARGHEVRAVVSGWKGAVNRVTLDGIEFRRVGGRHTFPLHAPRAVKAELARRPADVLVEDLNKVPLFTPLWVPGPIVALVPHLFGETAFAEAAWPLAAAVWLSERGIPRAYGEAEFQAISESTARDLERRGIEPARITVIPPGIDHDRFRPGPPGERPERPTLLYVGRLKRYKGIEVLFAALERLHERGYPARLVVAGRGDDRGRLEAERDERGLGRDVEFPGYIDEREKVRRLQRAWVAVYPSPKEGWGITNVEAAACGTPVVASDSPGLRESVADGVSGILVRHGDPDAWADALTRLVGDEALRARMRAGAIRHAARFSWKRAADETERHLMAVASGSARATRSGAKARTTTTGRK